MEPRGENSLSYRIINPNPNPNPNPTLDPDSTHSKTPSPPPPQNHQVQVQLEANIERNTTSSSPVRYRECLKNHAANIGGNVTDGCGEFMPGGEEGTTEALKCAACDCHRNFHRKDYSIITAAATANTTTSTSSAFYPTPSRHSLFTMPLPQSQQQQHHHKLPHNYFYTNTNSPTAPIMMSFGVYGGGGGGGGAPAAGESSSEDLNMFNIDGQGGGIGQSKKRFRTKFTQEQKEKMHVFAEKVGWKIQKQDEQELQKFCDELGIKRQVFKVWMHNNKQAMKKKEI